MSVYIAHYRIVPLSSNALGAPNTAEKNRLRQATEAGDAEVWIAQIVARRVPDCRTNHGKSTTALYRAESVARRVGGGWPSLRRCCRSVTWLTCQQWQWQQCGCWPRTDLRGQGSGPYTGLRPTGGLLPNRSLFISRS